jgi:hypothetical protein
MVSTFQNISVQFSCILYENHTTRIPTVQMPRETKGDKNKVWYKHTSETIHPLFTVTTFAFELKLELIGVPIVALGLQSV